MTPRHQALSFLALVVASGVILAPDLRPAGPPGVLSAAPPRTDAAPFAARPNTAYRLAETPDMPDWARQLYRDDVLPNVHELDREFALWAATESRTEPEESESLSSEEDPWEKYYERRRLAVAPFVQADGSIDFDQGPVPQPLSEAGRTTPLATVSTTWGHLGPISTVAQYDPNASPPQPLASMQSNIYCFDVAASNPNILYCGSETGAVSKTTDKGQHWVPVGLLYPNFRTSIGAIAIHPTNPNVVYVGNGAGINTSTDGGANWTLEYADAGLLPNDIKIRPGAPGELLVAGSRLLRRSAALAWTEVLPRVSYDLEFKPGDSNTVYALVRHSTESRLEFLKSTDGGQTFSVRSTGWLTGLDDSGGRMTVTPADPGRIYAVVLTTDGPRILRSNDSGESWSVIASNPANSGRLACAIVPSPLPMDNGQGYYDLSIAASATNADHLITGTVWAFRSVDAGVSYTTLESWCSKFPVHADVQEMKNVGGDSWIATDGGMNLSTDFWATPANFSSRTNGLRGTQCWGFGQGWNEDALVSGRYHNRSGAWHEGFPPGRFLTFGDGEPITGYINPANSRMMYDLYAGGVIMPATITEPIVYFPVTKFPHETENRGGGFPSMDNGEQEWDPRFSNVYYIGRRDGLWVTRDNGATFSLVWDHVDPDAEVQHIEVARTDPNVIYVTVWRPGSGELYRSDNGGGSFVKCADAGSMTGAERKVSTVAVSGTDPNVVWWCFRGAPDGQKIFKSVNGGQSWTNRTTTALNGVKLADMAHQLGTNGGIYLSGDFGAVFYRNDAMPDWVTYNAGLPAQLNAEMSRLRIQYKYRKLRMASLSGFWQVNLYENSTTTLVQPMVDRDNPCPEDTLQFESYSVVNGNASYQWSFSPPAQWISNANVRNPRVVLGWAGGGSYTVTLTVTDDNGVTQRSLTNPVNLPGPSWASSVVGFSSQYSPTDWGAIRAVGPPDVYPAYGDHPNAWASATEDDQPEFIELAFSPAVRANFVEIVETFNPGALIRVSVKNPGTNLFEPVWAGVAAPAGSSSRIRTIPFPEPSFLVGEVRLDFDSPAVPGWNEIDAVGIGFTDCGSTLVSSVPSTEAPPATTLLRWVSPNPFNRSVRFGVSLGRTSDVTIDVFNVLGQHVARLAHGTLPAAEHEISWDGRDAAGQPVTSGTYYVRIDAGGIRESRKLIKIQ